VRPGPVRAQFPSLRCGQVTASVCALSLPCYPCLVTTGGYYVLQLKQLYSSGSQDPHDRYTCGSDCASRDNHVGRLARFMGSGSQQLQIYVASL
jgi:hypothetical protein